MALPAAWPLPGREARRAFWALALGVDLALLLLLAQMPWVAAALLAAAVLLFLLAHPEWALAFLFLGGPLLTPLRLTGGEQVALQVGLMAVFLLAWWHGLGRTAAFPAVPRSIALVRALGDRQGLIVLALALLLWAGAARTPAPLYGDLKWKSYLLANLPLFFAPLLLWPRWREERHLNALLRAGCAIGALFAGAGVLAALGWIESGLAGPPSSRLAWLGTSPIWVARHLAIWILLLAWAASRRLLPRLPAGALILLGAWLLLRTGSRGPVVALLAAPAALLLLPARGGFAARARAAARGGALALLLGATIWLLLPEAARERTLAVLLRGAAGTLLGGGEGGWLQDPSSIFRGLMITRGLDALQEVLPWGAGTGGFPALLFLRDFTLYPHNIEIELLVEQGWPGLLLFLALLAVGWCRARDLARAGDAGVWLFVLMAMAALNAQVSGDISGNAELWFWCGCLAGLHRARRPRADRR